MTGDHGNPLGTVVAVRLAEATARNWTTRVGLACMEHMPTNVSGGDVWLTAVALVQRDGELAEEAAQRLALYLTLHAERYGRAPRPMTAAHHLHDANESPEQE